MNKVFKIIWNKTTQSFVVTSELAKGAVKASSNSEQRVTSETRLSSLFKLSAFALSLSAVMMPAQAQVAEGGVPKANVHSSSIGIGNVNTQAKGPNSIAVGNDITVNGGNSSAIGNNITASKNRTISVGNDITARYQDSIFLGDNTGVAGTNNGERNILIGKNAQVGDTSISGLVNQAIAIGAGGNLTKDSKDNITQGAWARGDQSIAIGGNVIAYGNSSVAIGGDDTDKSATTQTTYTNAQNQEVKGTIREAFKALTDTSINRINPNNRFVEDKYQNTKAGEVAVSIGAKAIAGDLSVALGAVSNADKTK